MKFNELKIGDRLEYIGPPRGLYQNKADHASFYQNHRIIEIVTEDYPRLAKILYGEGTVFAFLRCEQVDNPEITCGGYKLLKPEHWKVL